MSESDLLLLERSGRLLTVTLNRPEARNAVNNALHRRLELFFKEVAADDGVGAILLTGAGRSFCAGGDVKEMAVEGADTGVITSGALNLVRNLVSVPQPIVAAVNGDAVGLGATLALLCDVVLAAENARIGDPHVRVGLVAGDGGAVIWPLLAGVNRAKEYLLTGDLIAAPEAERIGLVNHVYPAEELMPRALELARRLADGPAQAVRWTKQAVNKVVRAQTEMVLETSLALEALSAGLPDHAEGARAYVERRAARFNHESRTTTDATEGDSE